MNHTRKEFLKMFVKGVGCFSVAASLPFMPNTRAGADNPVRFPQGVASGDPTPDSVVLWTRAVPETNQTTTLNVTAQISRTSDFTTLVAEKQCTASAESDYTIRLIVHDLEPDTRYYYRFISGEYQTDILGRTRTAPSRESSRDVTVAFASCQSYEGGYYHAYRELIERDKQATEENKIDFLLHLGDFIYETLGYGSARKLPPFPSGGGSLGEDVDWARSFAVTLDDYRHLYRHYLMDPDLKEARARWPFIVTWDDHEFTDDSWQGMATYTTPGKPSQRRKLAANRAWFEYIPVYLTGIEQKTEIPQHATDFIDAAVNDAPIDDFDDFGFSREENNTKAINSLTIYRSFHWGRHIDLLVTDTRSYRSRHPVPGKIALEISGNARYVVPLDLVKISDAGRTYNNGNPPETIQIGDQSVSNLRKDAPSGTMLGEKQKEWFKNALKSSSATWKVIGSSVPMVPMRMDLQNVDPDGQEVIFTTDTWEGYLNEREELLSFIKNEDVVNVISLAGDNHNSFAGILSPNFEKEKPDIVGAEFSVCGVSSTSVFSALSGIVEKDNPLRPLITFDGTKFGLEQIAVENLNTTFLWGAKAAATATKTGRIEEAAKQKNPLQNPHLRYVDSNAYGIGLVTFSSDSVTTEFITLPPPVDENRKQPLRRTILSFPVQNNESGLEQDLELKDIIGQKPFPLI